MFYERRHFPRYAIEVDAVVVANGTQLRARTRDLSRSGMCFVSQSPVQVGISVEIRAALRFGANAWSEALPLAAKVMWCTAVPSGYQVGVMFLPLAPQVAEYLDVFLKYLRGEVDMSGQPIPEEDSPDDDGDRFA